MSLELQKWGSCGDSKGGKGDTFRLNIYYL